MSPALSATGPTGLDHSGMGVCIGGTIEPMESFACENLINKILRAPSPSNDHLTISSTSNAQPKLAAVLQEAATIIKLHAKWFLPSSLAVLLDTALNQATRSTSSSDLYGALKLLDRVCTYSFLPTLQPSVRFIAYAYYQGSRENRHRRLSQDAWVVASLISDSHLGPQLIPAVLDILQDRESIRGKIGLLAALGSLSMISDHYLDENIENISSIPTLQLLNALRGAPLDVDPILPDQILRLLQSMLSSDILFARMAIEATLALALEVIQAVIPHSSRDKEILDSLFQALEVRAARFEPRMQPDIAAIYVENFRPLPLILSGQLLVPWQRVLLLEEDFQFTASYRDLLGKLCACSFYTTELEALIDIWIQQYFRTEHLVSRHDFAYTLETLMTDQTTAETAIEVLGAGLVKLFAHKTHKEKWKSERVFVFSILCRLASQSRNIVNALLRIRADAAGEGYLQPEDPSEHIVQDDHRTTYLDNVQGLTALPLETWVEALLQIITGQTRTWEIYELCLDMATAQFQNHALWQDHPVQMRKILRTLCEYLKADSFREPPVSTGQTKSNVISYLIQMLTAVITYHANLIPADVKLAIITIINLAGSRDATVSIQCIHALSICCFELPMLMAAYMDIIIVKMSKMVTQKSLALYVLEFFSGLSRLPVLQDDLRHDDFKRIFGVCHSYLQTTRAINIMDRKQTPSSERSTTGSASTSDDMAQYVYALTHHVITFWYMSLNKTDRRILKPYITSCLQYTDADLKEHVEDQGLVTIDLMDRIDADEQIAAPTEDVFDVRDGRIVTKHRVTGLLLITTETALRTGKTLVTIRRPSGTARQVVSRQSRYSSSASDAGLSVTTASATVESDLGDYMSIFPDDLTGDVYGRVAIPRSSSALGSSDVLDLPTEDESVHRAIQSFDRTSALDSHKAGVIYIGESQTKEDDILLNQSGSPDYRDFLGDLGKIRRLKGANFNSQGLDRADDADGEHVIVWNNDVTELVYHVTTMMPSDPSGDSRLTIINKKRHIGNDFVNIVFNNSGIPFQFNTFPSAFNYVYIVISPSERTSFIQARTITACKAPRDRFYDVIVRTRPGFPSLSSANDCRVISGASLGGYIRNLALNACVFSTMWMSGETGEYPSSWRYRLQMIRRLNAQHRSRWT